jgi:ubiquitin C-terminal hydrolase
MVTPDRKSNLLERDESKKKKKGDPYQYNLVGVLVHSGSADAGHYYSFIKERNKSSQNYGKWFEFNDTQVKEFDIKNLRKECFGG